MAQYRSYRRPPRQSTKALTVKLALLAVIGTLLIGGLIAAQMAAGNDPALGPKAVARAKKASNANSSGAATSSADSGTDPNTQTYGDDGYSGGSSSGSSSGSSGSSSGSSGYSSGSSGYSYSPPPVTSSTS